MTDVVSVRRINAPERSAIDAMAQAYYSEVLPDGPPYFPAMLDRYWSEPGRHPYLIDVDGAHGGFALVWNHEDGTHELAEFTVHKRHRHKGIGTQAALLIFESLGGEWTLGVTRHVSGAWDFWESCLGGASKVLDLKTGPPKTAHQCGSFTFRVVR